MLLYSFRPALALILVFAKVLSVSASAFHPHDDDPHDIVSLYKCKTTAHGGECVLTDPHEASGAVFTSSKACRLNCHDTDTTKSGGSTKGSTKGGTKNEEKEDFSSLHYFTAPKVTVCPKEKQVMKPLPGNPDVHEACSLHLHHAHDSCHDRCWVRFGNVFAEALCKEGKCVCVTCGSFHFCGDGDKCVPCSSGYDCPKTTVYSTKKDCDDHCPFVKLKYYCDFEGDHQCKECKLEAINDELVKDCPEQRLLFLKKDECTSFCDLQDGCRSLPFWTKLPDLDVCRNETIRDESCQDHCKLAYNATKVQDTMCSPHRPDRPDMVMLRREKRAFDPRPNFDVLGCFCQICDQPTEDIFES